MPEINYRGLPLEEGTVVTTTRSIYNDRTREFEEQSRLFQINGENEDGSLNLVRCNETFNYNSKRYVVTYVGPNRR